MRSLEDEAGIYGAELTIFAKRQKLPPDLFAVPDHIVLRAANTNDFSQLVREEISPISKLALCVETEPRFKVAAELSGRLAVYDLGYVEWIEVDEPRLSQEDSILDRAEFYCDSLEKAITILHARGLRAKITPEKDRAYVGVRTTSTGLEFRLTDTTLHDVVVSRLEEDEAIQLSLASKKAA